jgi:quercetin dioxygenase-like cupin family protein
MSTTTVNHVKAASAAAGPRGEKEHVRFENNSLNHWVLESLPRGDAHSNDYNVSIYVIAGQLDVFPEGSDAINVEAGDSVLIPAGAIYSMSAQSAELIESRNHA